MDDDTAVRTAIDLLLNAAGYCVTSFASAEQFLEADIRNPAACLVLDLRMPGKSGLELQTILTERGIHLPIIFLSRHCDVAAAARAVRSGAVDFLEKPFEPDTLLALVREALARAQVDETNREARNDVGEKLAILTPREREVVERVANGTANKVIALDLGISERTVELHRTRGLRKMGTRTSAQLSQLMNVVLLSGEHDASGQSV